MLNVCSPEVSNPDPQFLQLCRRLAGPVFVRCRAGRAWMENASDFQFRFREHSFDALRREIANADHPFRLENFRDGAQVFVAGGEESGFFRSRQFVRREVFSAALDEGERTIVGDKMSGEVSFGSFGSGGWTATRAKG